MQRVSQRSGKALLIVKALLVTYIITALLLLLLALVMYKIDPPGAVISVGLVLVYIISSFVGGYIIGNAKKEKRFMWGIGMGVAYFLIIFIVSLIFGKDVFGSVGSIISILCMCGLGGMLGGMVS